MKNIYDVLNNTNVLAEGYEPMELNELEKASMKQITHRAVGKKRKSIARWATAAACMVCVIGFSQTAYAKEAINGILQSISLGHNTVVQMDPAKEEKPQVYDKDGKPITEIKGKTDIYDAKGNKIGTVSGKKDTNKTDENGITEKDLNKAASQLSFKLQVSKTIPDGYTFDHTRMYKADNGKASGNYIDLFYKNGDSQIIIQERRITNDTTYTYATDGTVEKVTVNGHEAAITDGNAIDWEQNGVSVSIVAKSLNRDGLLSFAKSFQ